LTALYINVASPNPEKKENFAQLVFHARAMLNNPLTKEFKKNTTKISVNIIFKIRQFVEPSNLG
jgi:hypothetical protein